MSEVEATNGVIATVLAGVTAVMGGGAGWIRKLSGQVTRHGVRLDYIEERRKEDLAAYRHTQEKFSESMANIAKENREEQRRMYDQFGKKFDGHGNDINGLGKKVEGMGATMTGMKTAITNLNDSLTGRKS